MKGAPTLFTVFLSALLLSGGSVYAEEARGALHGHGGGPHHQRPSFSSIDLNGDGRVEPKEFFEARANRLRQRTAEGRALKNLSQAPSFEDVDSNGDGHIDVDEFASHQQQRPRMAHQQEKQ